jgi:hypothetical protein
MYNNGNSSKNVTGASVVDGTLENADYADNAISGDKIDAGIISNFQSTGIDDRASTGKNLTISDGKVESSSTTGNTFEVGNTSGLIDDEFIGAFAFRSDDTSGTEPHYAGIKARANGVTGSMDLEFFSGRENYENDTPQMTLISGGGITFNGDTAAANALDDYEEGTWTPAAGDGVTTFVHTSQLGEYVKVGKQVTVSCAVKWSGIGSVGSGLFRITGLPFPFSSTTGTRYGAALGNVKEVNNNGGQLVLAGDNGVSHISFYSIHDNATYIAVAANSNDNVAGFAQFSATYLTD